MSTLLVYPIKVSRLTLKNYCYLILNVETKDAVLVDPAWEMNKIEAQLLLCCARLVGVLTTHHHFDHVNLANTFAQKYDVPVFMSRVEIEYYGFSCTNLLPIETDNFFMLESIKVVPLFTPGHTKGSVCFWIGDALFTGDTLFVEGCGICTGKGADAGEMFESLNLLQTILPQGTAIYPGHSYGHEAGKTLSFIQKNNVYLCFSAKEKFIAFRMRKGQHGLFSFR